MMTATLTFGILRITLAAIIIFFQDIGKAINRVRRIRLSNRQVLMILFGTLALIVFLEGIYILSNVHIK